MVTRAEMNAMRTRIRTNAKRLLAEDTSRKWNRTIDALTDVLFVGQSGSTRLTHRSEHRAITAAEQQSIFDKIETAVTALEAL